ncbi:MAG TPA: site-2 protease family protein [Gaiellaceae bacterium]|nr:site-2 protease family protein [Gaiellaceae bacterium]
MSAQAQQPRRGILDRLIGVAVVIGGFAKFFAFFVSFAAYSFWFGSWKFGLGFVLLILVHELGHVAEARRQGVHVTLPTFIPFIGAFVTVRQAELPPWRRALVSLAGPFVGGLGAAAIWAVGSAQNTTWLVVLANVGFLLNAVNLLPIGILDGGGAMRAIAESRRGWIRFEHGVPVEAMGPDREHATLVTFLYALLAAALVGGLLATRHSGML